MFELSLIHPKLEFMGYIKVEANMKEKHDRSTPSNHHWKVLKCRMIIFSTSSIMACPDKSDEKQIHIVFNQHGKEYDTLISLFSKFSLQQVGDINKVTQEMYLTCFRYTMTARIAPTWNLLGYNYLINNRDFLSTFGPQNGIQFYLNTNGHSINIKIKPVKIHFSKSDEPFLSEECVRVLPRRMLIFKVGDINKVTQEMYLTCFRYTMTARIAPTWNLLGYNYLINNRDFLSTFGPQNGIQFYLNTNGHSINIKIKPVKIHFSKSDEPFLSEECVRVLPSLNKATVKECLKSLPTEGDFKSFKDLRRHWKNIHGYRLPETESKYYTLQFWRGEPLTYPDMCLTRTFPIITPLPKSTGVSLARAFVETLRSKMRYNVGNPSVKVMETGNVLYEDENDNLLKTQGVSLCTPSQGQGIQDD